uniref:Ac52 n=1 Tax=Lymantria dispar multicapsid nuclear polyhedrosis virus TaxID=10449 RepID=A0A1B1MR22_NPVLD|nr:hypothetical protein [Lymantria dispar multiple nucleopolyhedrovirus]
MELIKPFVKYSRAYRTSDDSSLKNKIKTQIEIELGTDQQQHQQQQHNHRNSFFCDFCQAFAGAARFCNRCFFPKCETALDQELATYALLSVCYWELNEHERESHNARTVWLERIKFTWIMHENNEDKVYRANDSSPVCVQCQRFCEQSPPSSPSSLTPSTTTDTDNGQSTTFDENLFCPHCLFPTFYIDYRY